MVFQGEDVPLTKDIFAKKLDFFQTEAEWSSIFRDQIWVTKQVNNLSASDDLFTVPAKNTLFISSAFIGAVAKKSGLDNTMTVRLKIDKGVGINTKVILAVGLSEEISTQASSSISFPMPLRVEEGETIEVEFGSSSNKITATYGFSGWLVPKKIS